MSRVVLLFLMLGGSAVGAPLAEPPKPIVHAIVVYPPEADGSSAEVLVRVHVDATGKVTRCEVITGPGVFHTEAMRSATNMLFEPARRQGERVKGSLIVRLPFVKPAPRDPEADLEITVRGKPAGTWTTSGRSPRRYVDKKKKKKDRDKE